MSELTPELNLVVGEDEDDTADYLTIGLADSLQIIDGLFNNATGHAHNGAHQGGQLQFLDLTVGEDLTVNGTLLVKQSTTLQGVLNAQQLATLQSLDVTTTSRLRGAATFDALATFGGGITGGPLTITGNAQINGTLGVTGLATFTGGITTGAGGLTVGNTQINGTLGVTGATSLSGLTTGNLQVNGALGVTGTATMSTINAGNVNSGGSISAASTITAASHLYANGNHLFMAGGAVWMRWGVAPGRLDFSHGLSVPDLATTGQIYAHGGRINFEASNAVYLQWRGDLGALYMPYGNGLYLHEMTVTSSVQGGRPAYVMGQNSGGRCYWWPASAIGPPASVLVFQGNISGTMPYNNGNPNTVTCGIGETFDSIGINVESGYAGRVSRAGWYAVYAVAETTNPNWDAQGRPQWSCEVLIDGAPQANRFSTATLLPVEGGMSRATAWWIGFVNAGQWIGLRAWAGSFGYAFGFGGRIEFTYVPVTDYPN